MNDEFTLWKYLKFTLIYQRIFRQINSLITYLSNKPLLSRKFGQKCIRENSRNLLSVGYEHRSLEIMLGTLKNLPAARWALLLEMLEKNFARISQGSKGARKIYARACLARFFYARNA